jgi:hypothetical protein
MKTTKIFFAILSAVVLITTFYFVGCNQSTTSEPQQELKFINPYANVGEIHNEVFINVLSRLQVDKQNNLIPTEEKEVENKVMDYCKEYLNRINYTSASIDMYQFIVKNNSDNRLNKNNVEIIESLTPEQKYYSDQINLLIYRTSNLDLLAKSLNKLEKEISNKLSKLEAIPLLCQSSVALESKTYWKNNFTKWLNTFKHSGALHKTSSVLMEEEDIFNRLATADAYGALAGAAAAIASGQLELTLSWAVTGAAWATAVEAIVILIQLLF